ncbi:MAG TPA: hypothetical protein VLD59_04425, partial [Steroidobacteraceae bacterium]|nr:hypothetical protein [Steroidobacteraceae bacterium]
MTRKALVNGRVLTERGFVTDRAVLVNGARIVDVVARKAARRAQEVHDLDGRYLLPGFIDCQVNGGGGVLFNDDPTP